MRMSALAVSAFLLLGSPLLLAAEAAPAPAASTARPVAMVPSGSRINVNTADVMTLTGLKGVGEKKAQAIVAYRKAHGPFNSLEQFQEVPGIGPSIINKNKAAIVFR